MMMRALEAGGLDAAYHQSREEMRLRYADAHYDPNVGGLYELAPRQYRQPDFARGYEGRLIKALNMAVPRMAVMPGGIRVVLMRRDCEEVRQSYLAFFGRYLEVDDLDKRMEGLEQRILNRRDVLSLHVLWYRDVIGSPGLSFAALERGDWPIDVERAAGVVDPALCRYRLERLTVGVL